MLYFRINTMKIVGAENLEIQEAFPIIKNGGP